MERQAEILNFIKSKPLMTLACVNGQDQPESALLGFAEAGGFMLIFRTSGQSRKYKYISENPAVAAVIGWDGSETVQYQGQAVEVAPEDTAKVADIYFSKHPYLKQRSIEDERFFLIKPTWLRYTDVAKTPWDIYETKF